MKNNDPVRCMNILQIIQMRKCYEEQGDSSMHSLGVGTTSDMDNVITDLFFPSLRIRAYTPFERINIWRGKAASGKFAVHDESRGFNAF